MSGDIKNLEGSMQQVEWALMEGIDVRYPSEFVELLFDLVAKANTIIDDYYDTKADTFIP